METIAYNVAGSWTEISLTDLGVGGSFKIEFGTHGESKCILPLPNLPPETDAPIPFEAPCIIRTGRAFAEGAFSDGTILFRGRRTDLSGQAYGNGANSELVIEDAWYDLRFITMQAAWANITGYSGGSPTYGTPYTWPDCVLFQSSPGGPLQPDGSFGVYAPLPVNGHITTGQAIKEMLAYAIYFGGVDLQIGTIDPATYCPFYPVRSMRIADCIKMALRPHPDCACEIDYTTTPPTLHIRARANLTPLTMPYKSSSGAKRHLTSAIRPRPDLVPTRVGIYVKTTSQVAGNDVVNVFTDIYPVGASSGLRSLDVSLDINGPKLAKTTAKLNTAAFDPTSLAWWVKKIPALKSKADGGQIPNTGSTGALALLDSTVNGGGTHLKGIQVVDDSGNPISLAGYGYELVAGTPCDWMRTGGGGTVNVIEANVVGFFSYYKETTAGAAALVDRIGEHMHTCRVKLINTATATFSIEQLLNTGEAYPTGMAQNIYAALSDLQYNFTHTIFESPFATVVKPGKHSLNVSGGSAAWTSMNAMIQGVDMEFMYSPGDGITHAKTVIRCGPVDHLDAGELSQLFNLFANRDLSRINPSERSGGSSLSGGSVSFGTENPKENATQAAPLPAVTNVASVDATTGNTVNKIQTDATTGQTKIIQLDSATGAQLVASTVVAEVTGNGAPGPATLA